MLMRATMPAEIYYSPLFCKIQPQSVKKERKFSAPEPRAQLFGKALPLGRRRKLAVHEDGIHADLLDILPRYGQGVVAAKQAEQPWPTEQQQAFDACRGRVKLKIVCPAQAGPVLQLHDLFRAQFPKGHLPCPLLLYAPDYARKADFMQKSGKSTHDCAILIAEAPAGGDCK